jgi:hypothetical protein
VKLVLSMRPLGLLVAAGCLLTMCPSGSLRAEPEVVTLVDRAVVRFAAPEIGGERSPRFILERELSFLARLAALGERTRGVEGVAYSQEHVRMAMERTISETLLSSLRASPPPTERELEDETDNARRVLLERIGGEQALESAQRAEGITDVEVVALLRRQARASIYLYRMVAPMLTPTRTEVLEVYVTEQHPYRGMIFDRAEPLLRRWVVANRLRDAVEAHFTNARQRLHISVLGSRAR